MDLSFCLKYEWPKCIYCWGDLQKDDIEIKRVNTSVLQDNAINKFNECYSDRAKLKKQFTEHCDVPINKDK